MFGKEKTAEYNNQSVINKPVSSKEIKTLIGEGCKVEGNFFINTATRIDGTIKGDLTGDSGVVIGNQGMVEGNVCAAEVVVYGKITGNIETDRLELKKGSSVNGDLHINNISIENGAVYTGRCEMKQESPRSENHNEINHNVTELKAENA